MVTAFLVPKNNANSKLAADISATATSLSVQSGEGARFPSTYPFHITIDNEILKVTNRSSDTMTVTRAQESTSAASHKAGANVQLNITAKAISDLNSAVNALEISPPAHKTTHEDGGADQISLAGLAGESVTPQPPYAHKTSHQNGGSDQISLAGLAGESVTPQPPKAHAGNHKSGGSDAIKLDELANPDDNTNLDVSTSRHGLTPKAPNDTAKFLRGDASWATLPPGITTHNDLSGRDAANCHPLAAIIGLAAHASRHQSGGDDAIKLDDLAAPDDNTDLNVSTTRHGLTPKLPNDSNKFLNGIGGWSVPTGGSMGAIISSGSYTGNATANRAIAHGLGVTPKVVFIVWYSSGSFNHWMYVIDTRLVYIGGTSSLTVAARDSTNFYVGHSSDYGITANFNNFVYYWVALA